MQSTLPESNLLLDFASHPVFGEAVSALHKGTSYTYTFEHLSDSDRL